MAKKEKPARKTMTALEMANALRAKGVQVSLTFRKEGGARITKINGKSFKGSKGNIEARQMLGTKLSELQQIHLKRIKQKKGVFGKAKSQALPPELVRLQEQANKAFKKRGETARVTRSKIRYRLKEDGYQATMDYLKNALRYAKELAFEGSLIDYRERLAMDIEKEEDKAPLYPVLELLDQIIQDGLELSEFDFQELLYLTYEWEKNFATRFMYPNSLFARRAKKILRRAS